MLQHILELFEVFPAQPIHSGPACSGSALVSPPRCLLPIADAEISITWRHIMLGHLDHLTWLSFNAEMVLFEAPFFRCMFFLYCKVELTQPLRDSLWLLEYRQFNYLIPSLRLGMKIYWEMKRFMMTGLIKAFLTFSYQDILEACPYLANPGRLLEVSWEWITRSQIYLFRLQVMCVCTNRECLHQSTSFMHAHQWQLLKRSFRRCKASVISELTGSLLREGQRTAVKAFLGGLTDG